MTTIAQFFGFCGRSTCRAILGSVLRPLLHVCQPFTISGMGMGGRGLPRTAFGIIQTVCAYLHLGRRLNHNSDPRRDRGHLRPGGEKAGEAARRVGSRQPRSDRPLCEGFPYKKSSPLNVRSRVIRVRTSGRAYVRPANSHLLLQVQNGLLSKRNGLVYGGK
jgi:hypothetical protein